MEEYPQFMKLKSKRYLDQEVKAWGFRFVKSSSQIEEAKNRSNRKRRDEKGEKSLKLSMKTKKKEERRK